MSYLFPSAVRELEIIAATLFPLSGGGSMTGEFMKRLVGQLHSAADSAQVIEAVSFTSDEGERALRALATALERHVDQPLAVPAPDAVVIARAIGQVAERMQRLELQLFGGAE